MLTVKQESFAQLLASGMATTAAYRQAFNNDTGMATTITPRASRLAHTANLQARINELRLESAVESCWTRERYVLELWRRSQSAHQAGQFAASIKAIELIGKACGVGGSDRVEHSGIIGLSVLARLTMDQLEVLARPAALVQPGMVVDGEARVE